MLPIEATVDRNQLNKIKKSRCLQVLLCLNIFNSSFIKSLTVFLAYSLLSQCYSAHAAYCHSKLAQLLFSSHLHQQLQRGGFPLSSCAVDPGMVDTALYRHLWMPLSLAQKAIARLFFKVKHCPDFHLLHSHRH